ncbi:synaptotagmin-3-like isoform X1 [Cucurbita pepo subsp. pepo]|uniref:synaptotagmin-3-like isoform X1 n=3 Tax=Cucurbita pepo subsp. pepo TaxID=3664 RepID=UPI000C9DA670|nr:synaptotagmin-3-like isoform X1 [Cucurbita pepo subsp. pepo]
MGFFGTVFGILGFGIGLPLGIFIGFFIFVYSETKDVKEPVTRPLCELDTTSLQDLMPEIPLWVKTPDYDRVDWLNKFLLAMWPYLDKAICGSIRAIAKPVFSEYIGKFQIEAIELEQLSLGTLPPKFHGLKVYETNENKLLMEPAIRWAGNPNIVMVVNILSLRIKVQIVDLQIFATPRLALKPLVPTFPCFATIVASLMEKPQIDFGLKIMGGDIMSIPGFYRFIQDKIKRQVSSLYLWPRILEIPVLDPSILATRKPVGILHVKVVRASKLLKMDILGTSDPYVKLMLSGGGLPAKKTSIKMRNLNPVWNEKFKLIVNDPKSQVLQLQVYDWDKVGGHDRLGMQLVPLKLLTPYETKDLVLDLLKNTNINDHQNKKPRGKLVVELMFTPFREESMKYLENSIGEVKSEGRSNGQPENQTSGGAGVLSVTIQGAQDVEGEKHNNPYAVIHFRGERKKTNMIKKTRDPSWNEEFPYMLEEPPIREKIHIEVMSKRNVFSFLQKESLGHVEINLDDVVNNGRINEKYNLINSKNGKIHVEVIWTMA